MMGPYGSFGGDGWWPMAIVMIAIWGLVITGIVLLTRSLGHQHEVPQAPAGQTAALQILDERFARGDIDAEEYGRSRRLLITT